ncbi:MAG: hypothetical protein CMI09_03330 [Oceanospirillaceae bacterium]|nr:hypothetical protein [Oceanospirillaceae bacterium]|tara:strand:- start:26 stop:469 length:444 start_codon:yes stop_codon:yes gene_type:complete
MTQRCMISTTATGPLKTWADSLPSHLPGNHQGDPSWLSVVVPGDDVLAQLAPEQITYLSNDPDLSVTDHLAIVGPILAAGGDFIIIGAAHIWRLLHNTPYWRLWCGLYESDTDPQFTADKSAAGLPPEFTINQSRQAMFQHFSGAIS